MENKWIVLHFSSTGEPVMVNMDKISHLQVGDHGYTHLYPDWYKNNYASVYVSVKESIEEISKLMRGY